MPALLFVASSVPHLSRVPELRLGDVPAPDEVRMQPRQFGGSLQDRGLELVLVEPLRLYARSP